MKFKMARTLFATVFALIASFEITWACLFCKDFFPNGEQWKIVSASECWRPQLHYYFNCLGYIQCDQLPNGQYNASLRICPKTSTYETTGFDPEKGACSESYKCTSSSFDKSKLNDPVRIVPNTECQNGKRIHEASCKLYYKCEAKPDADGNVLATLQSCEEELGKSKVRFNPVLMWCEEGENPLNWECNTKL